MADPALTRMFDAAPAPDDILRARAHYERMGLRLTPIDRGEKRPPLSVRGWQQEPPSGPDLDQYLRAGAGLGCVHGLSGTATLDADAQREHVDRALAAVGVDLDALLSSAPCTIGNPERPPKPWFRVPEGYDLTRRVLQWPDPNADGRRRVIFELRAGPVQDVLPPTTHSETGEPYRWTEPPRRREDLPLVQPNLLGLWLAWDQLRPRMEAACPWARPAPAPAPVEGSQPQSQREGPSVIAAWNERVPAGLVLERNGYRQAGKGRWLAPDSTTGDPGVVELDGRIFTHHASDPLAGPHSHDSFSVLTVLEHGGNAKAAARSAALELGIDTRAERARAEWETLTGARRTR